MFHDEDLKLLSRPLYAFMTVAARPDRWPAPRPVWFELAGDGTVQMFSEPSAIKVGRLREQPRASIVVAAPAGEPEHWVSVEGSVTLHDDGGYELAERLAPRYWTFEDPQHEGFLQGWAESGLVRITLHPEKVNRFAA